MQIKCSILVQKDLQQSIKRMVLSKKITGLDIRFISLSRTQHPQGF
jgi:hypothetical protein